MVLPRPMPKSRGKREPKFISSRHSNRFVRRNCGMVSPEEDPNWIFNYGLIDDVPALSLQATFNWPSHDFTDSATLGVEYDDSSANLNDVKENGSRKRMGSGLRSASVSKSCREKLRRDRLNDRFLELGSILEPGRPKVDKAVILSDALRMMTQLRNEAHKLKKLCEDLQEKINELRAEKNVLRDEKQRLKAKKENIVEQVKAMGSQAGFLPHLSAIPAPFPPPGQVVGSKLMPFIGYPGVPMWQFMAPAAVDTSQDHALRPPVA